jgi:hypothetical protein
MIVIVMLSVKVMLVLSFGALPESQHQNQGLHAKDTYEAINRRLNTANNEAEARVILQQIGNEMKAGTLP